MVRAVRGSLLILLMFEAAKDKEFDLPALVAGEGLIGDQGEEEFGEMRHVGHDRRGRQPAVTS